MLILSQPNAPRACLLTLDDVRDYSRIINKLRSGSDPVSTYLRGRFPSATRSALAGPTPLDDRNRLAVIEALNEVILGASIYDASRFPGGKVSTKTERLLGSQSGAIGLARRNRSFLEDSYPTELSEFQVERRDLWRDTPLHEAARNGRTEVVQMLLEHGADVNVKNSLGNTPLDEAIFAQRVHREGNYTTTIPLLDIHGGVTGHPKLTDDDSASKTSATR